MTGVDDFDAAVEQYHLAAAQFVKGNPEPYKALFSQGEDVTVANPFGPVARGWKDVAERMERASSLWSEGEVIGFESLASFATQELGYIVEVERFKAKIGDSEEVAPVALRTTSILRREDGAWKILHRHADPITTARPAESVIQKWPVEPKRWSRPTSPAELRLTTIQTRTRFARTAAIDARPSRRARGRTAPRAFEGCQAQAMRFLGHVAVALVALMFLGPAPATASRSMWSIFEDHAALVRASPERRQDMLEQLKHRMGADTVRIEVKWNEVSPRPGARTKPRFDASDPSQYQGSLHGYPSFGPYDDLVRRAHAIGLRVLITITGDAPRWATAGGRGRSFSTANWKVNAGEYGRFVAAVAKRYSGTFAGLPAVRYFTIWNEPNHRQFLKPMSSAPRLYRNMVDKALPQVRRHGARGVRVFVGELAPVGRAPRAMGPTAFLRRWLCLDTRFRRTRRGAGCRTFKRIKADGFAHHPYGPTSRVPRTRDVINMLAIRRLGHYLDRARAAKRFSRRLSIYNTEFGLQSNPPDRLVSTSLARQAALINEKEEYAYRYWRLKSHSHYLMFDDPARPGPPSVKWSGFQTGLRFASGRVKPSFNAYRFPIVVKRRRHGARVWGRVRPGTGTRYVRLQRRGGSLGPRIKTNSRGYFGAVRRISGSYRFRAYDRDGRLIGTSRTASPIG